MTSEREWHPTPERRSGGFGIDVKCNGQLGYAKLDRIWKEKLASDLAKLVCAPVPLVEFGTVKGMAHTISYVHSEPSRALRTDDEAERANSYSSAEAAALKAASGLLPFLAWIGAEDHNKDSDLVIDDLGDGRYRVVAIDFEHAFTCLTWISQT